MSRGTDEDRSPGAGRAQPLLGLLSCAPGGALAAHAEQGEGCVQAQVRVPAVGVEQR
jgi:hypothetical protein